MAELSWAHQAGARRRETLDRDAKHDRDAARRLVGAMFDRLAGPLWNRLGHGFRDTVEAYNTGGRFADVSCTVGQDAILVERRHEPAFSIALRLDRAARQIQMTVRDGDAPAMSGPLEVAFVDDELFLWHDGQTENGYQVAARLLRPRL
jgi:hypothetical protein